MGDVRGQDINTHTVVCVCGVCGVCVCGVRGQDSKIHTFMCVGCVWCARTR